MQSFYAINRHVLLSKSDEIVLVWCSISGFRLFCRHVIVIMWQCVKFLPTSCGRNADNIDAILKKIVWYAKHGYLLETAYFTLLTLLYFYFRKKHILTYSSKIKVPQFLYCQYICMYVPTLQPTPFELASWNLKQGVYIWLSQNAFFFVVEIFALWGDMAHSSIFTMSCIQHF